MKNTLLSVCVLAALAGLTDQLDGQVQLTGYVERHQGVSRLQAAEEEYQPIAAMLQAGSIPEALATRVTVRAANEPLERVLAQIATQARLGLSYGPEVARSRTRVTLDVKGISAAHALAALERGTAWTVLATPSGRVTLMPRASSAVQGTIAGRVINAGTQQPISGASVAVEGTARGTLTGTNGRFTIANVPAGTHQVRARFVGYAELARAVTVTEGGTATVDFELTPQAVELEGVVAVGYGTVRRRDVTGAVGSVTAAELDNVQAPSISQALQGRVAGVNVTQNSAAPGGGVSVRIRGNGSIGTTNEPLWVIDGVPISGGEDSSPDGAIGANRFNSANPLSFLSPEDIESIEVLKDASSTAIYGARGSNGVVLITTKKGKPGISRMQFESSIASQRLIKQYDMLSAREFAEYANEFVRLAYTDTVTVPFSNPSAFGEGVDWQDEITRDAPMMQHQIGLMGGTEQTRFSVSGSYMDQQGVVRNSEFQRYTLRAHVDHQVKSWFRAGTNLNLTRVNQSFGLTEGGGQHVAAGATGSALNYNPLIPAYHPDGTYTSNFDVPPELERFSGGSDIQNPLSIINEITDRGENDRALGNLFLEFDLLEGLMLRLNGGATVVNNARNEYHSSLTWRAAPPVNGIGGISTVDKSHYLAEAILNYNRAFGDLHRLDFTAGTTVEKDELFSRRTTNRGFPNDVTGFYDLGAGAIAGGPSTSSHFRDWSLLSYLGRANYTIADRYLFTLTGRADGSSKFGADNKWGYFPSGAIAWRVSEEPLLGRADWLNELKLRASYGFTGNQEIGSYNSLTRLGLSNYVLGENIVSGYRPVSIPNPELRWEQSEQFDLGLDAALFDNRFTVALDVYDIRTRDLLLSVPLPYESGFSSALQNLGKVRNRGVELSVGSNVLEGSGRALAALGWYTSFNVSTNRNRVEQLGERKEFLGGNFSSGAGMPGLLVREGLPMGVFYGYETDGLFRSEADLDAHVGSEGEPIQPGAVPGQVRFVDQDGDGKITTEDRVVLGNPEPDFTLGWTNDIRMGAFNLYTFLQGTYGNEVYSVDLERLSYPGLAKNLYAPRYQDAWRPDNPSGKYPVLRLPAGVGYSGIGTRRGDFTDEYLFDGGYVRLKSVTLSYNVPARVASRLGGASDARLMLNVENALTWTNYGGANPDLNTAGGGNINRGIDFNSYPIARVYRLGVRFGM